MKKIPLLPVAFRWIGMVFILFGVSLYAYDSAIGGDGNSIFMNMFVLVNDTPFQEKGVFKVMEVDVFLSTLLLTLLIGLSLIAFARQKTEDEMINSLRLYSWSWSVILMILISIVATTFVYGLSYISFVMFFGHILLLLYLIIFYYNMYRMDRRSGDEE